MYIISLVPNKFLRTSYLSRLDGISITDPNEVLQVDVSDEEWEDGVARPRTNTLSEQAAETSSVFSSGDKRTNVLETDDTTDMIITVEHVSAHEIEEDVMTEFPLETRNEIKKHDVPEANSSSTDKTDNRESLSSVA